MKRNTPYKKTSIKKNDIVVAIAGRNKGKKGKVLEVLRDKNKVIVEGLNFVKKHTKPSQQNQQGGIFEKEAPLHISNVLLYSSSCDRGVRVKTKVLENKNKIRICSQTGDEI